MTARPQAPKEGGAPAEYARALSETVLAGKSATKGGGLLGRVASFVDSLVGGKADEEVPPPPPATPPPPVTTSRHVPAAPMQQANVQGQRPPSRPETEPYPPEVIAWARGRGVGDLDLVFLVDETGSMGSYIAQVKARLLELVDTLRSSPLARSLRLGLVTFRDHPPQDASFVSRAVPLTDDIAAIRLAVSSMNAAGGGDGPEALTDGLVDLVRLDWRPGAARVAVLVGDAPPHGVEPSGDGFPEGCPCGQHWYTQAENCREMGVVVHALGCLPTLRGYAGAEDVFRTVAKTTRGMYLPLDQASRLVPLIVAVAEAEIDRQRITEHVADVVAAYAPALAPSDDAERVRFVTDVLREAKVRPRAVSAPVGDVALPVLRFRELEPADVEAALDQLRRAERVAL
jgi:Mg-chelatase subunit ChlD